MNQRMTRELAACLSLVVVLSTVACGARLCRAAEGVERMLSHDVYFTLKDRTPQGQQKLIAACKKYLSGHPGTVWFAAGPLAAEFQREVNDRDFDVALHLVFKNEAAHDRYQTAEGHVKFIEENQALWEKVRVFDSYVDALSHGDIAMDGSRPDEARSPALPDAAAGFAGMIQGTVVQKRDAGFTFKVSNVAKVWDHNRAKNANALVGATVVIAFQPRETSIARFSKSLKPGAEVSLDVAHHEGEALTIVELTGDQRKQASSSSRDK